MRIDRVPDWRTADEIRARTIQNVTQPEKHTGIRAGLNSYFTPTHTHTHNPHDITVTKKLNKTKKS